MLNRIAPVSSCRGEGQKMRRRKRQKVAEEEADAKGRGRGSDRLRGGSGCKRAWKRKRQVARRKRMQKGVEKEAAGCEEEADAKGIFKSCLIGSRYNLRLLPGGPKKQKQLNGYYSTT